MKILSGNSNLKLAKKVSDNLNIPLVNLNIRKFLDQEIFVEILENVRGEDLFVIQSTSNPANDNLMELLIIIDALKRGSAKSISAIIPYYGYSRQDRKTGPRTPISAKLTANLIATAGADRVLTFDLHNGQIQGFFDVPTDNLYVSPIFVNDIKIKFKKENIIIVSPDIGGTRRAREIADRLECDIAIIEKRRFIPGKSKVMNVIGDVQDKICILIDDMIDSGGTIINASEALIEMGAKSTYAYASHGVFSNGIESLINSQIKEIVITDTINIDNKIANNKKIRVLSIAPMLSEAINRINKNQSVSSLFL